MDDIFNISKLTGEYFCLRFGVEVVLFSWLFDNFLGDPLIGVDSFFCDIKADSTSDWSIFFSFELVGCIFTGVFFEDFRESVRFGVDFVLLSSEFFKVFWENVLVLISSVMETKR